MKSHLTNPIRNFFLLAIYLGPLAFFLGTGIAVYGELSSQANIILTGLIFIAAGLVIWGCHGMRRRGKRPGFVLMASLGSTFFFLHLYYRYSDYRWAKFNGIAFDSATSATSTYLESRVILFVSIFLMSAVIGLLPPLPAANSSRKILRSNH